MIPRYKNSHINNIWSTNSTLERWKNIELAHVSSLVNEGLVKEEEFNLIKSRIKINIDLWRKIESTTKHDLQAFVQMLEESINNKSARWIHYGLTSSDIIDTSLSIACVKTLSYASELVLKCLDTIKLLATDKNNISTFILGRTHGKAAEKYSLSILFNRWHALLSESNDKCIEAIKSCSVGKLSGPCGNNSTVSKKAETIALYNLGLKSSSASSQIISRQIYLDYFYALLKCALSFEKIANDIRHYSIEGIDEMSEGFVQGQKGSSAMPHKKNPIKCENLLGLSRMCKSYFQVAVDNCNTLWERDISNSGPERIIFKDMAHLACFGLTRIESILFNLQINYAQIEKNISKVEDKINSQKIMNNFIREGYSRAESHDKVQQKILSLC